LTLSSLSFTLFLQLSSASSSHASHLLPTILAPSSDRSGSLFTWSLAIIRRDQRCCHHIPRSSSIRPPSYLQSSCLPLLKNKSTWPILTKDFEYRAFNYEFQRSDRRCLPTTRSARLCANRFGRTSILLRGRPLYPPK
jgi:hypothetical protein